ncbi:hypothetical protein AYY22_20005 [Photobacterium kishitanii]|nr:hypothetical protein AYY22_20005 [Photobacterium kishitanii]
MSRITLIFIVIAERSLRFDEAILTITQKQTIYQKSKDYYSMVIIIILSSSGNSIYYGVNKYRVSVVIEY